MAATLSSSSCNHFLHHLRRPPHHPPSVSYPIFAILLKPRSSSARTPSRILALPISVTTSSTISSSPPLLHTLTFKPLFVSPSSLPLRCALCTSSAAFNQTATNPEEVEHDDDADVDAARIDDVVNESDEGEEGIDVEEEGEGESVSLPRAMPAKEKPPILSVKEKKELASYAHSLGKKLTTQLVGKSGVTVNVAASFIENLESNELLKIKIHRTCPGELDEVVNDLELCTGSVVVSKVGRTVIIYRPSLTKLKAEEKKQQARRIYVRKDSQPRLAILRKGEARGVTGSRGQRGRSSSSSSGRGMRSYSAASS